MKILQVRWTDETVWKDLKILDELSDEDVEIRIAKEDWFKTKQRYPSMSYDADFQIIKRAQ